MDRKELGCEGVEWGDSRFRNGQLQSLQKENYGRKKTRKAAASLRLES